MLSRPTVTEPQITPIERFFQEMGKKLHEAAGQDIRNKIKSGEIALVDGRYTGECLQMKRPPRR